jgi:hypothetical protein
MRVITIEREFWSGGAASENEDEGKDKTSTGIKSGQAEVSVGPFDPSARGSATAGPKWQISTSGGDGAHWRADGKELVYMGADHSIMSVDVTTSPVFQAVVPKALFRSASVLQFWEATADAQHFLIPAPAGANAASPYKVVLNRTALLSR